MIEIPQIMRWERSYVYNGSNVPRSNLSIIEILRVKIGRHIMKNCGEKKI
jgi:hypothetical protein